MSSLSTKELCNRIWRLHDRLKGWWKTLWGRGSVLPRVLSPHGPCKEDALKSSESTLRGSCGLCWSQKLVGTLSRSSGVKIKTGGCFRVVSAPWVINSRRAWVFWGLYQHSLNTVDFLWYWTQKNERKWGINTLGGKIEKELMEKR